MHLYAEGLRRIFLMEWQQQDSKADVIRAMPKAAQCYIHTEARIQRQRKGCWTGTENERNNKDGDEVIIGTTTGGATDTEDGNSHV